MLKIVEPNEKITEEDITELEKDFRIKLPEDYKKFLLKYNGGNPEDGKCFYFEHQLFDYITISEFYSLDLIEYSFERLTDYPEEDWTNKIKKKILGFCLTGLDKSLGIGVGKKNNGKIYVIDPEEVTDTAFILVANSFTELMKGFKKCKSGDY